MSINHITFVTNQVPDHHGVVIQGQVIGAGADFRYRLHTFKIGLDLYFLHPNIVVVSYR